jgi:hypothetical protein
MHLGAIGTHDLICYGTAITLSSRPIHIKHAGMLDAPYSLKTAAVHHVRATVIITAAIPREADTAAAHLTCVQTVFVTCQAALAFPFLTQTITALSRHRLAHMNVAKEPLLTVSADATVTRVRRSVTAHLIQPHTIRSTRTTILTRLTQTVAAHGVTIIVIQRIAAIRTAAVTGNARYQATMAALSDACGRIQTGIKGAHLSVIAFSAKRTPRRPAPSTTTNHVNRTTAVSGARRTALSALTHAVPAAGTAVIVAYLIAAYRAAAVVVQTGDNPRILALCITAVRTETRINGARIPIIALIISHAQRIRTHVTAAYAGGASAVLLTA